MPAGQNVHCQVCCKNSNQLASLRALTHCHEIITTLDSACQAYSKVLSHNQDLAEASFTGVLKSASKGSCAQEHSKSVYSPWMLSRRTLR